jgi:hypothetical protein
MPVVIGTLGSDSDPQLGVQAPRCRDGCCTSVRITPDQPL